MTTIVGDSRRMVLVSDSLFSDDDNLKCTAPKVYKIKDFYVGGAGHQADIEKVLLWLTNGGRTPKLKHKNDFLMLRKDGIFSADQTLDWERIVDKYEAVGSGAMAALAVLRFGGTAEEAVEIACQIDLLSGGPVTTYRLEE